MIEETWRGVAVGVEKLAEPDALGNTYRIIVVDGSVGPGNQLVPGSGSGRAVSIFMDDACAHAIHEGTADASPIVRPPGIVPVSARRNGDLRG